MARPSVHFHLPPLRLFKFPPDPEPATLPPPTGASKFASPFPIDAKIYNDLLSPYLPVTIAIVYASVVLTVNRINRERGFKPFWISTTRPFFAFVVLHNVFLAIFSGLTFVAMLRALRHTWPSHREYQAFGILWPGLRTQNGFAGAADALCKMHGPRGFGDAASYNAARGLWEVKNKMIKLGLKGVPDSTDVGRLWNEGLAFWGWWFYLSKFYEVVDTAIILLKGKKSSTLQMYHHAGAMLCMWAGIRYMSAPIWMFVFINSGIHALMYVYYTLSAVGVRVPRRVKKTLTTMQISQFLIGFTFAAGHLFVSYTIPSRSIYAGKYGFKAATSAAAVLSTVAEDLTAPTATAAFGAWLKKLAFRAAGQEGLAENVRNSWGEVFGPEAEHVQDTLSRMVASDSFATVPCLDTTGQSFAIWLNCFYLAPLTWLFLRFFIRSYSKRTSSSAAHPTHRRKLSRSASDAAHGVNRELESLGRSAEDGIGEIGRRVKKSADKRRISETIEKFERGVGKGYDEAIRESKALSERARREGSNMSDEFAEKVGRWNGEGGTTPQKVKEYAQSLLDRTPQSIKKSGEQAKSVADHAAENAAEVKEDAKEEADEVEERTKEEAIEVKEEPEMETDEVKEEARNEANEMNEEEDVKPASPQDSGVLVDKDEEPAEDIDPEDQATGAQTDSDEQEEHAEPEGLSTTDPREEGESYADKLK